MSTPISKMTKKELIEEITESGHSVDADETVALLRSQLTAIRAENEPAPEPKPLDISTLRKRRIKREEGFEYILNSTTDEHDNPMPTTVRARIPDILDTTTLNSLPESLRTAIFDLTRTVEEMDGKAKEEVENMPTADLVKNFGDLSQMADAYVIAGFIEPRVYGTAEEADENGGAWVSDIPWADRIAFFEYCSRRERGAAQSLRGFSKR